MKTLYIDGSSLDLNIINDFLLSKNVRVDVAPKAKEKIKKSRAIIEKKLKNNEKVYGVTTGFGPLSDTFISKEKAGVLQRNFILSHASGVGDCFKEDETKLITLLRANTLAKGYSGVRLELVEALLNLINKNVFPCIPEKGSVGASGDLAPLAHLALVLIGEGEAIYKGRKITGKDAIKKAGLKAVVLQAKEGLSLTNGTQVMTAICAMSLSRALKLSKLADISASMCVEALLGTDKEFDKRVHKLRGINGQIRCAENMLKILAGSEIIKSHKDCDQVQDAYSLRCIPQVHGIVKENLEHIKKIVEAELNSVTDNPLVFENEDVVSQGNFHGEPVAMVADILSISISELANISERRIARLVDKKVSGLPAFLVKDSGVNSGFMIPQYAAASLVSENKTLAHPASVDSIPTSAGKEDHVSMGTIAARKARQIVDNAINVIAIEFFAACQAIDFRKPLKPGKGTHVAYKLIREKVKFLDKDRVMYKDIDKVRKLITQDKFIDAIEKETGKLN